MLRPLEGGGFLRARILPSVVNSSLPSISVLVLNLNGRGHLDACLSSLEAQVYPRERFEIEVVDNGSTDGSLAFIRARYPRVRVLALERNRGFCAPYNAAIQRCDSDFVALLNNDARVDPHWLAELVSAADRHRAAAVASKILDWTGETIDFVGGVTSFIGHSWQRDFGAPASRALRRRSTAVCVRPVRCCSAATAFLDAGAFDEDFFAYFEDVDLGWRLNLFGHDVVLAPRAVTYHRLHGTSSRWALTLRLRLLERNALAMIYKNYEAATLARVLPAAIALSLLRGLRSRHRQAEAGLFGAAPDESSTSAAPRRHLIALEDFCRQLPELRRKRALIQQRRRRSDAELFELFGDPFRLHEPVDVYEEIARALIRDFGIDEIFGAAAQASPRPAPADPPPHRPACPGRPNAGAGRTSRRFRSSS